MTDQFEATSKDQGVRRRGAEASGKLADLSERLEGVVDHMEAGDIESAKVALVGALHQTMGR
jgi:hypothetical protein